RRRRGAVGAVRLRQSREPGTGAVASSLGWLGRSPRGWGWVRRVVRPFQPWQGPSRPAWRPGTRPGSATASPPAPLAASAPRRRPEGTRHTAWMPFPLRSYDMGAASTPYQRRDGRERNAPGATAAAGPPRNPRVTRPAAGRPERATWQGRNPPRK